MRRILPLVLTALLVAVCASRAQSARGRIDSIDTFFASVKESKKEQPQGTVETWIRMQESLRDLAAIATDTSTAPAEAWRARWTAGYGYWLLELFDVAASLDGALAESAPDRRSLALALKDRAQSLENAGAFGASVTESERLIAATDRPGMLEFNNHALRLLKAGRYDECLRYVDTIALDAKTAHTRIFAARALAYHGRYDSARAALQTACDLGVGPACSMLEGLAATTPEKYWTEDREFRQRVWQPYNRIDSAVALAAEGDRDVSWFAPAYWFDTALGLYPPLDGAEEIRPTYPPSLPRGRMGVAIIGGVPFVAVRLERAKASGDAAIARYLATLHAGARALLRPVAKAEGGGEWLCVVYADWQEALVRASAPAARWRVVGLR